MCFAYTWNGRKWLETRHVTSVTNQLRASDVRRFEMFLVWTILWVPAIDVHYHLLKKPLVLFFNTVVKPTWSSLMSTLNSRLISFVPFDDRFLNCLIMCWNEAEVNCTVPQFIHDRKWTPKWTVNDPRIPEVHYQSKKWIKVTTFEETKVLLSLRTRGYSPELLW